MSPKLRVQLQTPESRPGEVVRGRVEVIAGGGSRRLVASLHQRDRSEDYTATMRTIDGGVLHEGDLTTPASFEFAFTLPDDAVPSFQGRHGETFWEVHLQSDEPGLDTHARARVTVLAGAPGA